MSRSVRSKIAVENGRDFCDDRDSAGGGGPCPDCIRAASDADGDPAQNQEYHEGVHNPHEVDAHRMENEPVRLRDEREAVGVAAEQEQYAQNDVRDPCCKRNQHEVLQGGDTSPNFLQYV